MKVSVTVFTILVLACIVNASVLDPVIENVVHFQASKPPNGVPGVWRKKTIWKPRWVKEWKSAKVMKPVWRKIWSPIQIKEWVPIPKPPPGWDAQGSTPLTPVKTTIKIKHSTSDQQTIQSTDNSPKWQPTENTAQWQLLKENTNLWDPIPYPDSQQPPPPSSQSTPDPCGSGGCADPGTFSLQQISGIINSNQDYLQGAEYSESVTHLTRVSPNADWRSPQQSYNFQTNTELSQYLVPPRFQPLTDNKIKNQPHQTTHSHYYRHHLHQNQPIKPATNGQSFRQKPNLTSNVEPPKWKPLPTQNNIKGNFITKATDHPYKFQTPEIKNNEKEVAPNSNSNTKPEIGTTNSIKPQVDSDFITQAQLVSEYHYSDFTLPANVNLKPRNPEINIETNQKAPGERPISQSNQFQQQQQQQQGLQRIPNQHNEENKPRQVRTGLSQQPFITSLNQQQSSSSFEQQNSNSIVQHLQQEQNKFQQQSGFFQSQSSQQQPNNYFQHQQSKFIQQQQLQLPQNNFQPQLQNFNQQPQQQLQNFNQQSQEQLHSLKQQPQLQQNFNQQQQVQNFHQPPQENFTQQLRQQQQLQNVNQQSQQQQQQNFNQQQQQNFNEQLQTTKTNFMQEESKQQQSNFIQQQQQSNNNFFKQQQVNNKLQQQSNSNSQLQKNFNSNQKQQEQLNRSLTQQQQQQQEKNFNSSYQQEFILAKEIFPIYEQTTNTTPFPSNHRFAPLKDHKLSSILKSDIKPLSPPIQKPDILTSTTTMENIYKTTTPFTVYPSSSLTTTTTTESQTNSPVYIVTPAYTAKPSA